MAVTAAMVKEVRERTGAGMLDCKKALDETNGDIEKALDLLREKGLSAAANKAGRIATEGAVGSYIHAGGRIGVLWKLTVKLILLLIQMNLKLLLKILLCKFQHLTHVMLEEKKYLRKIWIKNVKS